MSAPSSQPIAGFSELPLREELQRGIAALGFTTPRPIQAEAIPAALEGRDVLGLAQTGTGKTAAFSLPILQRLLTQPPRAGARTLILAPTRELASQIHAEILALAKFTKIKAVTLFGGVTPSRQVQALRARPEILVACPGRLLDLKKQGFVSLDQIEVLVLDEADHMFDMGFLPDVRRILAALPRQRQNLLFSATMPTEVRTLAHQVLHQPHVVELAHSKPAETVEHALYPVASERKFELLRHLLAEDNFTSAIVFLRTKHRAKKLAVDLCKVGHNAVALQGNMSQPQRERAMAGFRQGQFDILVATDIAARGIDVAGVSHVVNFDIPNTPDAYTHRIGRTGRAERNGKAFTFIGDEDRIAVRDIERKLGAAIPRRVVSGFEVRGGNTPQAPRHGHDHGPRHGRDHGQGRSQDASQRPGEAPKSNSGRRQFQQPQPGRPSSSRPRNRGFRARGAGAQQG